MSSTPARVRTRVRMPTHLDEWLSALVPYGAKRRANSVVSACPLCGGNDRLHVSQRPGRVIGGCRHCIDGQAGGSQRWLEVCRILFGETEEDDELRRLHKPRPTPPPAEKPPDPAKVAGQATTMLQRAALATHPYLDAKGFPDQRMMVLDETLLVPMRPIEAYGQVANLQRIEADGSKKFLYGGRAKNCVYHFGRGVEQWWCEGLATALSVQAALQRIYRPARVSVCFSSATLSAVARRGFVVADHDWWQCRHNHRWDDPGTCPVCGQPGRPPAGEKAAKASRLPWWQPPKAGDDANDHHILHGLDSLADELLRLIKESRR